MVAVDCVRSVVVCIISMLIFSLASRSPMSRTSPCLSIATMVSVTGTAGAASAHAAAINRSGLACTHAPQSRAVGAMNGHATPDRRVAGNGLGLHGDTAARKADGQVFDTAQDHGRACSLPAAHPDAGAQRRREPMQAPPREPPAPWRRTPRLTSGTRRAPWIGCAGYMRKPAVSDNQSRLGCGCLWVMISTISPFANARVSGTMRPLTRAPRQRWPRSVCT